MVVYHAIHPDFSKAFDDNGDEDEFDPNPDPTNPNGIFWGRGPVISFYAVNEIACGEGSVGVYGCRDRYRLWINFGPGKNGCGIYCI